MDLIDDQGRLFGLVNVVDVLVVLFVVAVVVAGIALVDPFAAREETTRYATIDLGVQPNYLAERVTRGDRMDLENSPDNLTITDVYRGPGVNGTALTVRVRINGELIDPDDGPPQFLFGGEPFLVGQELAIETVDYTVTGDVTRVGVEDDTLPAGSTAVAVTTTVSAAEAEQLSVGDAYRVDGQAVAVLQSLQLYPTAGDGHLAVLGLELNIIERGATTQFGDTPVQLGATIPFRTPGYDIAGEIVRIGTTEPPGEPTTTTVTLRLENVPPERAGNIQAGQTETIRGETFARIVDKDEAPAVVILTSEDGDIFEREHPRNLDLTLTVELQTRRTATDLRFHGQPLRIGDTVVLDLGQITVEGEVTGIDG